MASKEVLFINNQRRGYSVDQVPGTMTVKELRDYLDHFNDDMPVYISNDNGYTFSRIIEGSFDAKQVHVKNSFTLSDIDNLIINLDIDKSKWGVSCDGDTDAPMFFITRHTDGKEFSLEFSECEIDAMSDPLIDMCAELEKFISQLS